MIWLVTGTGTVLADCIGTVSLPIGTDRFAQDSPITVGAATAVAMGAVVVTVVAGSVMVDVAND